MAQDVILPPPVARFFDASNRRQTGDLLNQFSETAVVYDWDRVLRGRDDIGSWNLTDNIGVGTAYRVVSASTTGDGRTVVEVHVTGTGYQGDAVLVFRIADGKITELTIPEADRPS